VLTVLFATRNGAATLPAVLETYCRLESPQGGWKLVVVDNGSTDSSRQIIANFEKRLPLTYVFEPEAGKNVALNTGLPFVSGDIVLLTDDDAFPRPDWLVRLRDAADSDPTVGIFGGAVVPRWETAPPRWLLNWVPLGPTYTVSDSSLTEGPLEGDCLWHVVGPNMAVRSEIFHAGHRFDPLIGPNGSRTYAMGSETEFVLRLTGHGVSVWYSPTAIVEHFVRTRQMRPCWLIGRAMRFGRSHCRLDFWHPLLVWGQPPQPPPSSTPRCFGFPLPLLYQLARKTGSVFLALLPFSRERLFRSLWVLSYVYGYGCESRGANRKPRAHTGD
jgi:glycosyltransferase involved in cell wall biosynthesis